MSEHLAESLRPWLQQPAAARIAHLQAPRWIGTQAARNALDLLQACLDRAPALRTRGVMLIGRSFIWVSYRFVGVSRDVDALGAGAAAGAGMAAGGA